MSTPGAAGLGSPERIARAMSDVVAVMDRLRSPGGCPWDAEQTHAGLAPYAIEEAHEVAEAAESGDGTLREELGDLLLQVLFQARIAQEGPDGATPFDLADVARTLEAKLRRRHPHVFADATAVDAQQVAATWEDIKAAERAASPTGAVAGEASVLAGVPTSLPALAAAQKVLARARRAGIAVGPSYPSTGMSRQTSRPTSARNWWPWSPEPRRRGWMPRRRCARRSEVFVRRCARPSRPRDKRPARPCARIL